eukprot:1152751-Pelagomonas_calceolata.AAC.1
MALSSRVSAAPKALQASRVSAAPKASVRPRATTIVCWRPQAVLRACVESALSVAVQIVLISVLPPPCSVLRPRRCSSHAAARPWCARRMLASSAAPPTWCVLSVGFSCPLAYYKGSRLRYANSGSWKAAYLWGIMLVSTSPKSLEVGSSADKLHADPPSMQLGSLQSGGSQLGVAVGHVFPPSAIAVRH